MSRASPRRRQVPRRHDDIDVEPDELGRDRGEAFRAPLRPAILYRNRAPLDPTKLVQPRDKGGDVGAPVGRCSAAPKDSDGRQLARGLGVRGLRAKRWDKRNTAEQGDAEPPAVSCQRLPSAVRHPRIRTVSLRSTGPGPWVRPELF